LEGWSVERHPPSNTSKQYMAGKISRIYETEIKGTLKVVISIITGFTLELLFLGCSKGISVVANRFFPSEPPIAFAVLHIITTVSSISTAIFFLLARPAMIIFNEYFPKKNEEVSDND